MQNRKAAQAQDEVRRETRQRCVPLGKPMGECRKRLLLLEFPLNKGGQRGLYPLYAKYPSIQHRVSSIQYLPCGGSYLTWISHAEVSLQLMVPPAVRRNVTA